MAYRPGDETATFEAKIEHSTAKAHLVEFTLGGKYWLPKSQIASVTEADEYGNRVFEVAAWWNEKKEEVE